LKSLLIGTALIALAIEGLTLRRIHLRYREHASYHFRMYYYYKLEYRLSFVALTTTIPPEAELTADQYKTLRQWRQKFEESHRDSRTLDVDRVALATILAERAVYHDLMRRKYSWASDRHWVTLEPDSPPP
jgi:hypothetical protein